MTTDVFFSGGEEPELPRPGDFVRIELDWSDQSFQFIVSDREDDDEDGSVKLHFIPDPEN